MTESELKLVADHMGHNLNVHTDVYRLQSSLLEKTKVARVLIASENGSISKFQGRRLDAISMTELPEPIDFEDSWTPEQVSYETLGKSQDVEDDAGDTIMTTFTDTPMETEETPDDQSVPSGTRHNSDTRKLHKIQRVRWTEEENKLFRETFHKDIVNKTMPPGSLVVSLSKKLPKRTTSQIRTKMHNIITGKLKRY